MKSMLKVRRPSCKLIGAVIGLSCCSPLPAAQPPDNATLPQLLAAEQAGQRVDRASDLAPADDEKRAHWQSGHLQVGRQWKDVAELGEADQTDAVKRYLDYRKDKKVEALSEVEYHRHLAKWCNARGLTDIAKTHWLNVLELGGRDAEAVKATGYQQVDGQWFSPAELADAQAMTQAELEGYRRWLPRLRPIMAKLTSGDAKRTVEALAELRAIDDPAAVKSLHLVAAAVPDETALPIIEAIAAMKSEASCDALLAEALADPSSPRSRLALRHLVQYDPHFFVPQLIEQLEAQTTVEHSFTLNEGGFRVQSVVFREKSDVVEVERLTRDVVSAMQLPPGTSALPASVILQIPRGVPMVNSISLSRRDTENLTRQIRPSEMAAVGGNYVDTAAIDLHRQAEENRAASIDERVRVANALLARRQSNARTILATLTQLPVDAAPQTYWDWWKEYSLENLGGRSGSKPQLIKSRQQYERGPGQLSSSVYNRPIMVYARRPTSCLTAGTLIATDAGLRPVESLKAGDLVVSQNIETGEISLKPVLRPTSREPARTFVVTTDNDKIRSTGGHHWWVVGQGWVKSRDLKAGMALRTPGGYAEIRSVEEISEPVVTYNLAVADNHTYFVGRDYVLSYDVTPFQPTLLTVPGYAGEDQVAAR